MTLFSKILTLSLSFWDCFMSPQHQGKWLVLWFPKFAKSFPSLKFCFWGTKKREFKTIGINFFPWKVNSLFMAKYKLCSLSIFINFQRGDSGFVSWSVLELKPMKCFLNKFLKSLRVIIIVLILDCFHKMLFLFINFENETKTWEWMFYLNSWWEKYDKV